jgi:hypothetical protein
MGPHLVEGRAALALPVGAGRLRAARAVTEADGRRGTGGELEELLVDARSRRQEGYLPAGLHDADKVCPRLAASRGAETGFSVFQQSRNQKKNNLPPGVYLYKLPLEVFF